MKKVKIVIVCLGTLSSGEASIVSSCFGMKDERIQLHAVVSGLCASYFSQICGSILRLDETADRLANLLAFNNFIVDIDPDLFVCADLSTMNYSSNWSGIDIDQLKYYKVKIAGMDQYSRSEQVPIWDWLDIQPSYVEKNNPANCDLLIRPVPLNQHQADFLNILHCPLFPEIRDLNRIDSGLEKNFERQVKRIFIANSYWEYNEHSPRLTERVIALRNWMPELIYQYVALTGLQVEIIHVGPRKWQRSEFTPGVSYRHYASLDSSAYQNFLKNSDVMITTNVTSITMSSALRYGTPCILLYNPKPINFKKLDAILPKLPSWYASMARDVESVGAFRMFPWGWNQFLKNVVEDNAYINLIFQAPIFEPNKCAEIIRNVLTDVDMVGKFRERSANYFGDVSRTQCLTDKLLALL